MKYSENQDNLREEPEKERLDFDDLMELMNKADEIWDEEVDDTAGWLFFDTPEEAKAYQEKHREKKDEKTGKK